jgi:hypothetical protein
MEEKLAQLEQSLASLSAERDEYKRLYLSMLELCRKLERGILAQKRERFVDGDASVTMSLLGLLTGSPADAAPRSPLAKRCKATPAQSPRAANLCRRSCPA